ncbi:MAG: response regulator [Planctomycetes bacterium]|nr:response regulator [Planctomycetota bacterium]
MCPITDRPAEILLVEDNPGDVALTRAALREGKVTNNLYTVSDGEAALAYLYGRGEYADLPRPDLVLLDLNLPKKDGREVLAEMKGSPELRSIPVVILTSSEADEDILRAYDLNVNCYITKPVGFARFMEVVRSIGSFWFTVVTLPSEAAR